MKPRPAPGAAAVYWRFVMKTLTAYFSRRGMNYAGGKLVDLKVGNTERAARLASELAGGALFELRAEHEYA